MTSIVSAALKNTRLVMALIAVVIVAGTIALQTIPKEAQPDIPVPLMMVRATYPGISPEDSERLLVKPLETYLRSLEGLKNITAVAYEGTAVVLLEFDVNFNKEKALADVRAQVDLAQALMPADVDAPIVQEFNVSLFPVITVALSGNVPERTLDRLARGLRDEIKTIRTVLNADLKGNRKEILEVVVDPAKLEAYGISQAEMYNAVAGNNRLVAAGSLDNGKGSFAIKVPGVLESAQDVLNLPIRTTNDSSITLKDVASVRRTFADPTTFARINGRPAIAIDVTKRSGANIIQNNADVRRIVTEASKNWPKSVHVDFMFDFSKNIRDQLGSLTDSITLAIVLVMIIIVAALGLRSGLVVGIAIPTSFLMCFLVLQGLGLTMNFMIMFALLLAVGILVDGAIIVVEYADRKMAEGHPPKQAFGEAAIRMFWPVVSATATMIFAFVPMLLWPGVTGKFMSYFPITLIIILSCSMLVALIFLPVLGGVFGRKPEDDPEHEKAIHASETGDWRDIPGITGWYAHIAEWLAHYPGKAMLGALGVVVAVLTLFILFNRGVEFFVHSDPDQSLVMVQARGNLSALEKRDLVTKVERVVATVDGWKTMYTSVGRSESAGNNQQGGVPVDNIGKLTLELKNYRERRTGDEILEEIRQKAAKIPGVVIEVRKPEGGPPVGKGVMMQVSSDNGRDLTAATAQIRRYMDTLPELRDLEDTRPLPGIEWDMDIDREVAGRYGANAQSVGTAIQLVTNGILVGKYRPDDSDDEIDIRVRYPSEYRGINALDNLRLATTGGGMVPISNFVKKRAAQQVNSIERIDGHRVFHVRANVVPEILPSAEVAKIKQWMTTQTFPDSVNIQFKGADQEQGEAMAFLGMAGFLALFLIAVVLLALFNSFYHAGLILVAVILAMIGALLGMVIMQQPFSVIMTGTGLLALAGIVVNHNIVLIDTFHRLLESGMDPIEAVIRSSAQRLRPVFLTTITAIGGLLPMMFAVEINFVTRETTINSPNSLMWVQLSTAIVFGLAFSKLITMGLIPALLALPYRMKEKGHGWGWFAKAALTPASTYAKKAYRGLRGGESTQPAE